MSKFKDINFFINKIIQKYPGYQFPNVNEEFGDGNLKNLITVINNDGVISKRTIKNLNN